MADREQHDDLPPAERVRVERRERKRATSMVVDNAGVRRIAEALARRRSRGSSPSTARGQRD